VRGLAGSGGAAAALLGALGCAAFVVLAALRARPSDRQVVVRLLESGTADRAQADWSADPPAGELLSTIRRWRFRGHRAGWLLLDGAGRAVAPDDRTAAAWAPRRRPAEGKLAEDALRFPTGKGELALVVPAGPRQLLRVTFRARREATDGGAAPATAMEPAGVRVEPLRSAIDLAARLADGDLAALRRDPHVLRDEDPVWRSPPPAADGVAEDRSLTFLTPDSTAALLLRFQAGDAGAPVDLEEIALEEWSLRGFLGLGAPARAEAPVAGAAAIDAGRLPLQPPTDRSRPHLRRTSDPRGWRDALVLAPPGRASLEVDLPDGDLVLEYGLARVHERRNSWNRGWIDVAVRATAVGGGGPKLSQTLRLPGGASGGWRACALDLARLAGGRVRLEFQADARATVDLVAIGAPSVRRRAGRDGRPDVVLVSLVGAWADDCRSCTRPPTPALDALAAEALRHSGAAGTEPRAGAALAARLRAEGWLTAAFATGGAEGHPEPPDLEGCESVDVLPELDEPRALDPLLEWIRARADGRFLAMVRAGVGRGANDHRDGDCAVALTRAEACVGRIVATLRETGRLDATLLAVELPRSPAGTAPWLVRGPGAPRGEVRDEPLTLADVTLTLAGAGAMPVRTQRETPGIARLLDRIAAWRIESTWSPVARGRAEEGVAAAHAFLFDDGTTGALADAGWSGPLPGTPPLRAGAEPQPGPPPRVAAEAARSGAGGLRFDCASGVAAAFLPVHGDTPYVFAASVRRGVDPARLAAGPDPETRARNAAALARDASVGSVIIYELHEVPPPGQTIRGLLDSFASRENTLVATHVLACGGSDEGGGTEEGEWGEHRLEFKSSIFTRALAVGLLGGNPGWWQLPHCARESDVPPEGAVDFDDVRLVELPLAAWLASRTAIELDELPCGEPGGFVRKVHLIGEARRALLTPPRTTATLRLELPRGRFRLTFGYGVLEERRPGSGTSPIEFVASLAREGAPPREILRRRVTAAASPEASAWQECVFEGEGAGEAATLVLSTRGDPARGEVAAFGEPRVETLRTPAELPRNVLLVSIDTLRADRLGCYGYARADGERTSPRLDAFARDCLLFANARTVAPFTLPSHATLFTGLAPRVHQVTRQGRRLTRGLHPLLAEEFAAAGFATGAFTGGAFVSYEHGFHHGFDRYSILDPFLTREDPFRDTFPRPRDRAWNDGAYARHDRDAIGRWIDAQAGRPFFLFVHTYVAHNYHPPAAIERRFAGDDASARLGRARDLKPFDRDAAAAGAPVAPAIARTASDVYDAGVAAADEEVGELLEALRARGLLDRTVVAIVSDHGEELGDHGGLLHGRTLYEELLRVPLLLRVPGVAPAVVDSPVDLCDVAPTLREAAGLPPEARCDGRSLLARLRHDSFDESFLAEVSSPGLSRRRALLAGRVKLIEAPATRFEEAEYRAWRPPELELFDLAADPHERENLVRLAAPGEDGRPSVLPDAEQHPACNGLRRALERRRAELDARRRELLPDAGAIEYAATGDARRLLEAVGYTVGAGIEDDEE